MHPGGKQVVVENYGSEEQPVPERRARLRRHAAARSPTCIDRNAPLSEDYQTEVTHPAWRAPIHKGDRIRITGTYENKDHAWYTAMTHDGLLHRRGAAAQGPLQAVHHRQGEEEVEGPDRGRAEPRLGPRTHDTLCGEQYGKRRRASRPRAGRAAGEVRTRACVTIANFQPTCRATAARAARMARCRRRSSRASSLTFVNDDQAANIRHSVTTCPWPCNGRYVGNYPLADGAWDSGTLGYDRSTAARPTRSPRRRRTCRPGKYSYFCRIHPFMRGEFRVVP